MRRQFDAAYEVLFTATKTAVTNFFRDDTSAVADAVAETMAQTFEHWERVRAQHNRVAWVVGCAKNVCVTQLRATARRRGASKQAVTLWETLHRLPNRERDVAVLRFLMDCDDTTTAAALGTSVANIDHVARSVRRRLPKDLRDVYADTGARA